MSKPILKIVAATSPLWLVAPATALQPATEPSGASHPQLLAQAIYRPRTVPAYYTYPVYDTQPRNDYSISGYCDRLGVSVQFCHAWIQEFVDNGAAWGSVLPEPTSLLNRLRMLSPSVRSKLGRYNQRDWDDQNQLLHDMGINPRQIDRRTNNRFYRLFPERRRYPIAPGEDLTNQIWWAIREDEIGSMQPSFWQRGWSRRYR